MRNDLRDAVVVEVNSRVVAACLRQAGQAGGMPLDVLVNETLYHEKKRLETHRGTPNWASDVSFWDQMKGRLSRANESDLRDMLARIVERFSAEVLGNFQPQVYDVATRAIPKALPLLLSAMSPKKLLSRRSLPSIQEAIAIEGNVEALRRCHERGTVILAPTHLSNLDSIVIGWALFEMGLPPFTYGAGLNLFGNPLVSFFMKNLGAYKVDRLKKAPLYKDVLKEYATVSLEFGQSNLFFPGGTRSRSGEVEQSLKLGLMSSGVRAYINNLVHKRGRPRIYVVPCTLNYHLVLEAETLIEDHLRAMGKSRYIITDDEFSRVSRVMHFFSELASLDSGIIVRVGDPLDVFGNSVDEDGNSLDKRGRAVDISRYVLGPDGEPTRSTQRDRVFTRGAGESVAASFMNNTVALSTQVLAFTMFEYLKAQNPGMDLYRLLRTAGDGTGIEMAGLLRRVGAVLDAIGALRAEGRIAAAGSVAGRDAQEVVGHALRHFATYHAKPVLMRRGDRVFAEDMNLLYFYRNRLRSYGLEAAAVGADQ